MSLTPEQVKQEREDFESWARSIGKTDRDLQREEWDGSGKYSWITEKAMFDAWQAGRALLRSAGDGRPPYPTGVVVGPCVCGSWPGGQCLKCEWLPAAGQKETEG